MKTEDISQFKGQLKSALQQWGNNKIDGMFPNKPQIRTFAKNGLNNLMARYDEKMNKWIDTLSLLIASENGVIDTDMFVDMAVDTFKELEPHIYQFEFVDVEVGNGNIVLHFPQSLITDLLFGGRGKFTFSADDIMELKEMFNN